ncbi:hypothetical protein JD491_11340 [Aeromonas caviae]|uniref:hypothetical protein n=1 Tax=Aeromonas caviae TaxID=648 RepID=UPI001923E8D7|nr:hypothetical protein [Aeromonas caviae]MBL0578198.1 hypothetical protein [Aeromonas caviae]
MLEYRLLLLIETIFNGTIPDERTVSNLFQTTLTESRSLIRSVITKYQYQLRGHVEETLKISLNSAQRQNNTQDYTVVINSQNIVDELNKALADIDGSLSSVKRRKTVYPHMKSHLPRTTVFAKNLTSSRIRDPDE